MEDPATVADVAKDISRGLAKAALAGKVNGALVDTSHSLKDGDKVEIITDKNKGLLNLQ